MSLIVRIVTGNDGGGVRTSELMYVSALRKHGMSVLGVIVGEGKSAGLYRDMFEEYVELETLPKFDGSFSRKLRNILPIVTHAYRESSRFIDVVRRQDEIVAVTTRQQPTLLLGSMIARALSKDLYWHAPGPMMGGMQKVFLGLAGKINRVNIIANSRYTARMLGAKDVVYPGFDPSRIVANEPSRYRRAFGIQEGRAVYAVIARFNHEKASDLIVEAFIGSRPFEEGAHLVMAGHANCPNFHRKVKEYANAYGNGCIHIVDYVEDVGNLVGDADVVINGRRNAEPFGISIVEAMGAGRPVLAFGAGGPEETVTDGETGWLVSEPTAESYREALNRSWHDRDRWPAFGKRGKELSAKFSIEVQVERYLSVLGMR